MALPELRLIAAPAIIGFNSQPVFLHDNSVSSLDELFDSKRGASAPHPFYIEAGGRADLVQYLKSLDTQSK